MNIQKIVSVFLANRTLATVKTEDEEYNGFFVDNSERFICLNILETWHLDGYVIIPKNKITEIEENGTERSILQFLGIMEEISKHNFLVLSEYADLFNSIKNNNKAVIIENSKEFALGEICEVLNDHVIMNGYTPEGEKENRSFLVPYDEISSITVEDEYSSMLHSFIVQREVSRNKKEEERTKNL